MEGFQWNRGKKIYTCLSTEKDRKESIEEIGVELNFYYFCTGASIFAQPHKVERKRNEKNFS